MARTTGARNNDYQEKRQKMAEDAAGKLLSSASNRPSMREFARSMDVSVNNLRHYFGNRDGLIEAALQSMKRMGQPHIERMKTRYRNLPIEQAMSMTLHELIRGWEPYLAALHVSGLSEGLGSDRLGPAYVSAVLEPTLQSFEEMLTHYINEGQLREESPRVMALGLLSPIILALLHQGALGGEQCRPLDMSTFVDVHLTGFLRGYGT
ncbi:MAG: hypothetical protein AAFV53_23380 [Myxococcota bacterium]